MSKKKNLIILALLILTLLLLSSCFLQPHSTEGLLKGQVLVPEGTLKTKDIVGQALPNATVSIIDLSTDVIIATTTTDSTGHYQVFVPAGGPYLLEAVKDGLRLEQLTCVVEAGMEYDLGISDCITTAAALIAQAMLDEGENLADIDCAAIIADTHFNEVSSIVCSIIEDGGDPTTSTQVNQAIEDFLHPQEPPSPSDAKAITAFDFKALDPDVTGVIDEGVKTITLTVPFGTEITALVPTIVHTGASISPASGTAQDFTSPVTYTVTAEDASTQAYLVTVTEAIIVINISAIPGVTAPVTGATPVSAITETNQYTGTVIWIPEDDSFQGDKVYIAMVILIPKPGFSLTGVPANFFTVAGATNVTNTADSGVVIAAFSETVLKVGDSYGGGIVAYIFVEGDNGYVAGEQHGLISATEDQSTGIQWYNGSFMETGATGTAIGTGQVNTTTIVNVQGAGSYAANLCNDLIVGNYNDWFLPSKDELNKLYLNKVAIGGFAYGYWSSSEYNVYDAWAQNFFHGYQYYYNEDITFRVRAVRAF